MTLWIADALVLLGVLVMTLAVIGVVRLPDVYLKLHAAGKAASFAIVALGLATIVTGTAPAGVRAGLVMLFLLLTAPVSAHAIARAAATRREPMHGEDALDESPWGLGEPAGAQRSAPD